jgi:hypothetical protein
MPRYSIKSSGLMPDIAKEANASNSTDESKIMK